MKLKIYNSLTNRKDDFEPLADNKVGLYVCGITAYDYCHIGHARAAVVFDVMVRYLRYRGLYVTHVQNFTDVDDKIINRAAETGVGCTELSERYIEEFHKDMESLGVGRADVEPKATDHIPDIIDMIAVLIEKGHAYSVDGNVYFAVDTFPRYGRLSHRNLDEMQAGARVEIDARKRNPMDFALWKASKAGEPSWDSPWGMGRPGWHIECSAMSTRYLGQTIDVHGGGMDLIFPHHENEIAQSEAATGKPFVRYFVHNGFVTINGEKMSKSLGNFLTIKDILSRHHPEALRLFLLSKHYRKPLDYSDESLREAVVSLDRVYATLMEATATTAGRIPGPKDEASTLPSEARSAYDTITALRRHFHEAMDDDLNTAQALAHVFDGVRATNILLDNYKKTSHPLCLHVIASGLSTVRELGQILGLLSHEPETYLTARRAEKLKDVLLTEEEILDLIRQREEARKRKDWAASDTIRKRLAESNVLLKDTPQGTTWETR